MEDEVKYLYTVLLYINSSTIMRWDYQRRKYVPNRMNTNICRNKKYTAQNNGRYLRCSIIDIYDLDRVKETVILHPNLKQNE